MRHLKLYESFLGEAKAEKMSEFQTEMNKLVTPLLSKKAVKSLEVLFSKADGMKPTAIQFDCEGDTYENDDEQEAYEIMTVMVRQAGDKVDVEQWMQVFQGNGGDDTKSTFNKKQTKEAAAKIVAKYINDWVKK